ncbi:acetyl-CoA carboxylase biotin carboxyl carrier protein [Salisediminibacterium beveridgei]|uniref:Biotin carboxyl carrier protein of acetyl-CoA carboxylase n=1 Tax=Salisediminibacterium beveridgei TaxID=632773 RepID=A0A1D7QUG5_9BACI|nr:acetyl-CoA carboxylase biotin carboxyl carrier protein [Salisediminibacterium beveridgei]AOM82666.1 Biotin carboxyl carrier protein of acetyl-CoA carboxylase [Salisediminibacterium beveridgei]
MLKIQEIREIIKLVDESSIDEFEFEQNGSKVSVKKHQGQLSSPVQSETKATPKQESPIQTQEPLTPVRPAEENVAIKTENVSSDEGNRAGVEAVTSPMVGTFYASPSPDAEPYVTKGDKVKADTVVCIVEAMKLMNEIEAEHNGEIVDILVENGELVEYGQELFLVKSV